MRIALCNEVIRELPFERQCAFARAVGYDGLEIAPFTLGDEPHVLPAARRAELRRAAADAGIAITGLHYLMIAPKGLSITSPDASQRARTVDVMRRLCDLAADLGAQHPRARLAGPAHARARSGGRGAQMGRRVLRRRRRAAPRPASSIASSHWRPRTINSCTRWRKPQPSCAPSPAPRVKTMVDCAAAARAETQAIPDLLRQWLPTGPHRPHPPQRPQPPRPRRGRTRLRADPAHALRVRVCRHGRDRALHLRARRPRLRRPRHRLRAWRVLPLPAFTGEGRGEGQRHAPRSEQDPALTLTLSPRKSGERDMSARLTGCRLSVTGAARNTEEAAWACDGWASS